MFGILPLFMAGTWGCWTHQTGWILSSGMDTASICVINWTKLIETGLCVYMHQWCDAMDKCFELIEILGCILNNRIWTFNIVISFSFKNNGRLSQLSEE